MADTGWIIPTTVEERNWGSYIAWTSEDNARIEDDNDAFSIITKNGGISQYLYAHSFPFTEIHAIQGIEVGIKKQCSQPVLVDYSVRLVVNNNVVGDNKALGPTWPWPNTWSTYGNSSDLWGLSILSPGNIDSTFGVVISAYNPNALNDCTAQIDAIKIKLYFKPASMFFVL